MTYKAPYQRGSETSKMAAKQVEKTAASMLEQVYQWLLTRRNHGATSDEIAANMGIVNATAGARRRDLELMGAVIKTGERRQTRSGGWAEVYRAVPGASLEVPKMGRPSKGDRAANRRVTVYLRQDQHADLCFMAADNDMELSEFIRSILDREISA